MSDSTSNDELVRALLEVKYQTKAYFEALGRFMHEFAQIEHILYLLMTVELNLETNLANAVLSGVKADQAIQNIKRIYHARGKDLPPRTVEAFEHISTLNTARNEIIHYGATLSGEGPERIVSTALKAHSAEKVKEWTVTPDTLRDMYLDAEKAFNMLLAPMVPALTPPKHAAAALARAWQYKYPSNPKPSGMPQEPRGPRTEQAPKGQPDTSGQ
jgi:hypothetical protein